MAKAKHLVVPLLTAIFGVLSFLPVPRGEFWFDEFYTANMATFYKSFDEYVKNAQEDPHPPLYYLYARAMTQLFGYMDGPDRQRPPENVEAFLRGINLPFAFGTTYLMALTHPLAGLALVASPSWQGKLDEARMYPLLGFLLAGALYGLYRRHWFLAGILSLLAMYTQYLSLYAVFVYGVYVLSYSLWRKSWKPLIGYVAPLLLWLPWLPMFIHNAKMGGNFYLRPDPISNTAAFGELGGYPLGLALGAIVLYGVYLLKRKPELAFFLLLPQIIVVLWWVSGYFVNTASPRYWGAFLPVQALSLGIALREALPKARLLTFSVFLGLLPGLLWNFIRTEELRTPHEGYLNISRILDRLEERQGRVVVLGNERGRLMALRYYHRSPGAEMVYPDRDYLERPWNKNWAGFLIFQGNIGVEKEGIPEIFGLALTLSRRGCETHGLHGIELGFYFLRCSETPIPDSAVKAFFSGVNYFHDLEKIRGQGKHKMD